MKAMKLGLCAVLLMSLTGLAAAAGFQKGSTLCAVQITEGVADLVGPVDGGYVSAYDHSEMGAQVQI